MTAPDFTAATRRWAPLAAQMLGWRPSEFWAATPAELVGTLRDPQQSENSIGPTRDQIAEMMERDAHGRQL